MLWKLARFTETYKVEIIILIRLRIPRAPVWFSCACLPVAGQPLSHCIQPPLEGKVPIYQDGGHINSQDGGEVTTEKILQTESTLKSIVRALFRLVSIF